MSSHTSGPWIWIDTSFFGDPIDGPNKNCLIGPPTDLNRQPYATDSSEHILYLEEPIDETSANARLIAAAPDLLAALRLIEINMANDKFVDPLKREMYLRVIRESIRKAEGT